MSVISKYKLLIALLLAAGAGYFYFALLLPGARVYLAQNEMDKGPKYGGDFYPIWMTGRELLIHRMNPYTQETTREIQTYLFGRPMDARRPGDPPVDYRAFAYPLYADLLAAPLLGFHFEVVRVGLFILLPLLTVASLQLWLCSFRLQISQDVLGAMSILLMFSYPVLEGWISEQPGLLVGAALAVSAYTLARDRQMLAGMLLAFSSIKPQLVWLLALWLLLWSVSDWGRRNRFALSFVTTTALLFLVSEWVLPGWFASWWRSLVGYSHYTLPPLTQLVLGKYVGTVVGVAMLILATLIGWRMRREAAGSPGFSLAVSFVLAVTVVLLPTGGAVYDQVVLLPALCWLGVHQEEIMNGSRPMRVLGLAMLAALGWQWVMASGVAVASLFWPAWANSPAVLVFPTRMAASVPFAVLAMLSLSGLRFLRRSEAHG